MKTLLTNRTFWLAILALVQTIVLKYVGIDSEVWLAIDAILLVVISSFTVEEGVRGIRAELKDTMLQLRRMQK